MHWFEKIYKERFSTQETNESKSDLDGIDSSALWDQISQSIPQEETIKNSISWWSILGILLFLGLIASGLIFLDHNQTIENSITENNPTSFDNITNLSYNSESPTINDSITHNSNNPKIDSHQEDTQSLKSSDRKSIQTDRNLQTNESLTPQLDSPETTISNTLPSNPINKNKTNSNLKTRTLPKQKQINKKPASPSKTHPSKQLDIKSDDTQAVNEDSKENSFQNAKISDKKSVETRNEINTPFREVNDSEIKTIESSSIPRTVISLEMLPQNWHIHSKRDIKYPTVLPFISPVRINRSPSPWSIKLITQINTFDQQYTDISMAEPFASEANTSIDSLQIGFGFGIYAGYKLNKTWSISSGLEMNKYENKLSTIISTDTMVFDITHMKNRNAKNIRTVRHNNKISTITIPLNISYNYKLSERFDIGSSIGLAYSFVTDQNVKILGRDNTFIEKDNSNKHFENYVSIRFNPYISYRLNDHFGLSMEAGYSMQSYGTSAIVDLKHNSTILSAGVGLKYSFN